MYAESSTMPSESPSDMLPKSSSNIQPVSSSDMLPESSSSKISIGKCNVKPIKLLTEVKCPSPDSTHLNLLKNEHISSKKKIKNKYKYRSFKIDCPLANECSNIPELSPRPSLTASLDKNFFLRKASTAELSNSRLKNIIRTRKCESQSTINEPCLNDIYDRPKLPYHSQTFKKRRGRPRKQTNTNRMAVLRMGNSIINNELDLDCSNSHSSNIYNNKNLKSVLPENCDDQSRRKQLYSSDNAELFQSYKHNLEKPKILFVNEDVHKISHSSFLEASDVDLSNLGLIVDKNNIGLHTNISPVKKVSFSSKTKSTTRVKNRKRKCRPKTDKFGCSDTRLDRIVSPNKNSNYQFENEKKSDSVLWLKESINLLALRTRSILIKNELMGLGMFTFNKSKLPKSGYFKPFIRRRGIAWLLNSSKHAIVIKSSKCRAGKYHQSCKNQALGQEPKFTGPISSLSSETSDKADEDFKEINDKYFNTMYNNSTKIRKQSCVIPEKIMKFDADKHTENSDSKHQQIYNRLICNDTVSIQDLKCKNQLSLNRLDKHNINHKYIVKRRKHRSRKLTRKHCGRNDLGFPTLNQSISDSSNDSMKLRPSQDKIGKCLDINRACNDSSSEQDMRNEGGTLMLDRPNQFNSNRLEMDNIKIDPKLIMQHRVYNSCKASFNHQAVKTENSSFIQDLKCKEESLLLENQFILDRSIKHEEKMSHKFVKRQRGWPKKLSQKSPENNKLHLLNSNSLEITNTSSNSSILNLNQQKVTICSKMHNNADASAIRENKLISTHLRKSDLKTDFRFVKRRRGRPKKYNNMHSEISNLNIFNSHYSQEIPDTKNNCSKFDFSQKPVTTNPKIQNEFDNSIVKRRRGRSKKLNCKPSVVCSLSSVSSQEVAYNSSNTCSLNQNEVLACHSILDLKNEMESLVSESRLRPIAERFEKHDLNIEEKFKRRRGRPKKLIPRCSEFDNMNLFNYHYQEGNNYLNKPKKLYGDKHAVNTFRTQNSPDNFHPKENIKYEVESPVCVLKKQINLDMDQGLLGKQNKKHYSDVLKGRNGWPRKLTNKCKLFDNTSLPYAISPEISGHSNNFSFIQPKYNYFKPYFRRPGIAWLSNISTQLLPYKNNDFNSEQIHPKYTQLCDSKVTKETINNELQNFSCVSSVQTKDLLLKEEKNSQNESYDKIPANFFDGKISFQKCISEESKCDPDNKNSSYLHLGTLDVDEEHKHIKICNKNNNGVGKAMQNWKNDAIFLRRKRGRPRKKPGKDFESVKKFVNVSKQLKSSAKSKFKVLNLMEENSQCITDAVSQIAKGSSHASYNELEDTLCLETIKFQGEEKQDSKLGVYVVNENYQSKLTKISPYVIPSIRRPGISWITNFQSNPISVKNSYCKAGKLLRSYNSKSFHHKLNENRVIEPKLSNTLKCTSTSDSLKKRSSYIKSPSTLSLNSDYDAGSYETYLSPIRTVQSEQKISNDGASSAEDYLKPSLLCKKNKPHLIPGRLGGSRKINKTLNNHSLFKNKRQSLKIPDTALICKEVRVTLERLEEVLKCTAYNINNTHCSNDKFLETSFKKENLGLFLNYSHSLDEGGFRTAGIERNPQNVRKRVGRPRKICKKKGKSRITCNSLSQMKLKECSTTVSESDCKFRNKNGSISGCRVSSNIKYDTNRKDENCYFLPFIRRPGIAWLSGIVTQKIFVKKSQCLAGKVLHRGIQMPHPIPWKMKMTRSTNVSKSLPLLKIKDLKSSRINFGFGLPYETILPSKENYQSFDNISLVMLKKIDNCSSNSPKMCRKRPSSSCKKQTKEIGKLNNLFVMRRLQFHNNLDNKFDSPSDRPSSRSRVNINIIDKSHYCLLQPKNSYFKPFIRRPGISWLATLSPKKSLSLISKKTCRTGRILKRIRISSLHKNIKSPKNLYRPITCNALNKGTIYEQLETGPSNDLSINGTSLCVERSVNQSHRNTIENNSTSSYNELEVANTSPNYRFQSQINKNAVDPVVMSEFNIVLKRLNNSGEFFVQENSIFNSTNMEVSNTVVSKNLNSDVGSVTSEKLKAGSFIVENLSNIYSVNKNFSDIKLKLNVESIASKESISCEKSNLGNTLFPSTDKSVSNAYSLNILKSSATEVEGVSSEILNSKSEVASFLASPECLNSYTEPSISISQEKEVSLSKQLPGFLSLSNIESSNSERDGVECERFSDCGSIYLHSLNNKSSGFKPALQFESLSPNTEGSEILLSSRSDVTDVLGSPEYIPTFTESEPSKIISLEKELMNKQIKSNLECSYSEGEGVDCEIFSERGNVYLHQLNKKLSKFRPALQFESSTSNTDGVQCVTYNHEPVSPDKVVNCSLPLNTKSYATDAEDTFCEKFNQIKSGLNREVTNFLPSLNLKSPIKNSESALSESLLKDNTCLNPNKDRVSSFLPSRNVNAISKDVLCKTLQKECSQSNNRLSSCNEVCSLASTNIISLQSTQNIVGATKHETMKSLNLLNTGLNNSCKNKSDLQLHNIDCTETEVVILPNMLKQGSATLYSMAESGLSKKNSDTSSENGSFKHLLQSDADKDSQSMMVPCFKEIFNGKYFGQEMQNISNKTDKILPLDSVTENSALKTKSEACKLLNQDRNCSNSIDMFTFISSLPSEHSTSDLKSSFKESTNNSSSFNSIDDCVPRSVDQHYKKIIDAPSEGRAIPLFKQGIDGGDFICKNGSKCELLSNNEIAMIGTENYTAKKCGQVSSTLIKEASDIVSDFTFKSSVNEAESLTNGIFFHNNTVLNPLDKNVPSSSSTHHWFLKSSAPKEVIDSVNSITDVMQMPFDKCCQKNMDALSEDRRSKLIDHRDANVAVPCKELPNIYKVDEMGNTTTNETFSSLKFASVGDLKPNYTISLNSESFDSLQEVTRPISNLEKETHSHKSVLKPFSSDAAGIVNIQSSQKEHLLNVLINNLEGSLNSYEEVCSPELGSNDKNTEKELEDTSVQTKFLSQACSLAANKLQKTLNFTPKNVTHKLKYNNESWTPYEIGFNSAVPVSTSVANEICYSQAGNSSNTKTQEITPKFCPDTISQLNNNVNNLQIFKLKKIQPLGPVAEKGNCDPYLSEKRFRPILPKILQIESRPTDVGNQVPSPHRPSLNVTRLLINRSTPYNGKTLPVISMSKDCTATAPSILPELRVMLNKIPYLLDKELQGNATLNLVVDKNTMKTMYAMESNFGQLNSRGHHKFGEEQEKSKGQLLNDSIPEPKIDTPPVNFSQFSKDTLVLANQIQDYPLESHAQKSLPSNECNNLFERVMVNVPSSSSDNPSCFNFQSISDSGLVCFGLEEEVVPSLKDEWLPVISSVTSLKSLNTEELQHNNENVSRICQSLASGLGASNESVSICPAEINQALEKWFPDINFPKCISNWTKMFPWMSFESSSLTINCSICNTDNNICKLIVSSDAFNVSSKLRAHSTTPNHVVMNICNNNQVYRQICSFLKFYPYYLHSHESLLDNIKKLTHKEGEVSSDMLVMLIKHIAEITEEKILSCVKGKKFSLIADNTRRMLILRYLSDADIICEHILLSYYLSKDKDPLDFMRRRNLAFNNLVYCNVPLFLENKNLPVYSKMFPSFSELLQWLSYSKCFIHYDNLIKTFSKYYKKLPHMFAFLTDAHLLNFPTICNLDLFNFMRDNLQILGSIGNEIHKVYGLLEGVGLGNLDLQLDTLQEVIETLSVISINFNKILNMKGFPDDEIALATFRHIQFVLKEKLSMAFKSANNEKLEAFSIMVIFVLEFCTKGVYTLGLHNTSLTNLFDPKKMTSLDSDTVDFVYNYVTSHYQTSKAALLCEFCKFGTYLLDKKKITSIPGMLELFQSFPELKVKYPLCHCVYKLVSFLPCFPAHRERSFFAEQVLLKFLLPKLSPELCVSLITVYVETELDTNC